VLLRALAIVVGPSPKNPFWRARLAVEAQHQNIPSGKGDIAHAGALNGAITRACDPGHLLFRSKPTFATLSAMMKCRMTETARSGRI
jgi:hypothetical protein